MNNEIVLRTNKGEYLPGESVFGAIYLRICRPTEGRGIKVTFKGLERCEYNYGNNGKKSLKKENIQVDYSAITLYSQEDCFQFGSYVFPFSFELPKDIAGTTDLSGEEEQTSWHVSVSYWITTWVIGSDAIQDTQPVVVFQCQDSDLEDSTQGTAKTATFELKRFVLWNQSIHITAKLVENYKSTGLNLQLRLIITNDSKVFVTGFDVKLKRYFKMIFPGVEVSQSSLTPETMTSADDSVEVMPEGDLHLIRSFSGSSNSAMATFVSGGLDNLQIPLVEKKSSEKTIDLPPSSEGKHFRIRYGLDVAVSFSNKHTETLSLVIPGVLPRPNEKWSLWKAPDWLFGCEKKFSDSLFSVSENILHSEEFSSLPVFQLL